MLLYWMIKIIIWLLQVIIFNSKAKHSNLPNVKKHDFLQALIIILLLIYLRFIGTFIPWFIFLSFFSTYFPFLIITIITSNHVIIFNSKSKHSNLSNVKKHDYLQALIIILLLKYLWYFETFLPGFIYFSFFMSLFSFLVVIIIRLIRTYLLCFWI